MECKVTDSTYHFVVVAQIVHTIVFGQAIFQFVGDLVEGGVADAQYIDTVAAQALAKIPVGFGKMRADENKIHGLLYFLSHKARSNKLITRGIVFVSHFCKGRTQRSFIGFLFLAENCQTGITVTQFGVDVA
ncbi:hypothetical protein SUBVAR_05445 [Subdoligranulum variabile DSM 15176]|uniref:Uncharacterized protein n=1 Tax=Subdoligranulum variabile DSM 15176 TaxID=411471 RepID=D1PM86_9FIRM|nr:hypothetical protein SUBVAR_05445 [Subdoligranulum variabile DSM 15176]